MSSLASIISSIAAQSVTVPSSIAYNGDKTPQVFSFSTLPATVADAKLPLRMVRLISAEQSGALGFTTVFGNETITRVPWRIYDLLLWRKLEQGLGIGSHEADLVSYIAAYVEALKMLPVTLATYNAMLRDARTTLFGVINYPAGSDFYYAGVELGIDIEERLKGTNPTPFS